MEIVVEVGTYKVLMISGYGNGDQIGFVYFYDPAGDYIGYAGIIKSGAPLPSNIQWPNGVINIYFHDTQFGSLLDTLRNERPVHVKYNSDLNWGSVGAAIEPTGGQDEPPRF